MTEPPEPDSEPLAAPGAEQHAIGVRERVLGLAAITAVLVAAGFGLQALRAPGGAVPAALAPEPTPTYTPVEIPDAARTGVHRSDTAATGTYRDVGLTLDPTTPAEATNAYTVRVEDGTNIDPDAAARVLQAALDDPRGWAGFGRNNFRLVPAGPPEQEPSPAFTVTIASPATTDDLCGPDAATEGLWSCTVDRTIVLNSDRWHYMVPSFNNLDEYRAYLINHQVGLLLGQRIAFCTVNGQPAPVMAQQERELGGCLPNAWPHLP